MEIPLQEFERAAQRLKGVLHHTELDLSATFSAMTGGNIYLKYENSQKTGSFKIRGASNKIAALVERGETGAVVASSAGNHAQGVAYAAHRFGIPAAERWARIEPYADAFELTGDLGQPISAYSHGMKQKLAIIAAWIHDPKLIIMDEPFVGLDPKAAHLLKGMMRELCDVGGAIFFSTHVLEVAEKLCDKVAIIKGGRLIRSGTMEEVKGDDSLEDVFLELEDASC